MQLNDMLKLNVNFGVLLSGGLDSSLITSIVNKIAKEEYNIKTKIKTFSIGLSENSVDLIAARKVAEFLDTDHTEFYFSSDEGISSIPTVIYYTETYDTTTIRASTPMYLLTKKIKEKYPELKVLFSGELSDELLCYLYGSNAPDEESFQVETVKLVDNVHKFDALRANKTCMANSIEVRVPFTDPEYIKYVLSIPLKYKTFGKLNPSRMEKHILRDAFNNENYLPKEILWRQKEAFSDGISEHDTSLTKSNWIDSIIKFCDDKYSNQNFKENIKNYEYNTPQTKEQLYYRELFRNHFNTNNDNNTEYTVEFWKPNWCNDNGNEYIDPSARKHISSIFQ